MKQEQTSTAERGGRAWPYELFVANRILRVRGRRSVSVITLVSVIGIILGVTALTVVLSITGGFQDAFRDRILGLHPHLVVLENPSGKFEHYRETAAAIRGIPEVVSVSPSTYNEMLAASNQARAGVSVKGLDMGQEAALPWDQVRTEGDLSALNEFPELVVQGDRVEVRRMVSQTSWSVIRSAEPSVAKPVVVRDTFVSPPPGQTRVRFAYVGDTHATLKVLASQGDCLVEQGKASRGMDVPPGKTVFVMTAGEARAQPVEVDLGVDLSYLLVLKDSGDGTLVGSLVQDQVFPEEKAGMGRVRSLSWMGAGEAQHAPYVYVEGELPSALLGHRLREKLGVEKGDVVNLVSPLRGIDNRSLGPFGMAPTSRSFRVAGWFESGFHEYDSRLIVVDYHASQRMLNRGDVVQWLDVRFDKVLALERNRSRVREAIDPYNLGAFVTHAVALNRDLVELTSREGGPFDGNPSGDLAEYLSNVTVAARVLRTRDLGFGYSPRFKLITWEEMNANLFSALKLQKVVLTIFFLIIIAVAAFNVVGSQIMMIHDKRASIAILKAMGAPSSGIMRIFLLQGCLVSAVGTAVGLLLGLGICALVESVGYPLDPEVYLISELPVKVSWEVISLVGGMALVLTTLTTLYSASRAARMHPVEGLRHLD